MPPPTRRRKRRRRIVVVSRIQALLLILFLTRYEQVSWGYFVYNDNCRRRSINPIPRTSLVASSCRLHTGIHSFIKNDLNNQKRSPLLGPLFVAAKPSSPTSATKTTDNNEDNNDRKNRQKRAINTNKRNKRTPLKRYQKKEKDAVRNMFQTAKNMERSGKWAEACDLLRQILDRDPHDGYSHLALARLEARREQSHPLQYNSNNRNNNSISSNSTKSKNSKARKAFENGVRECPDNVHLLQAWALYEQQQSMTSLPTSSFLASSDNQTTTDVTTSNSNDIGVQNGGIARARELYQKALLIDEYNPYVNHAYGLMEYRLGNTSIAKKLWEKALSHKSTAALVCSLGELLIASHQLHEARDLYVKQILRLKHSQREMTEVYLAYAWLEEKHFANFVKAEELINLAITHSPQSSRAHVALARLEGRIQRHEEVDKSNKSKSNKKPTKSLQSSSNDDDENCRSGRDAVIRRLANACISIENSDNARAGGRLYNAWATMEVKARKFDVARKILQKGIAKYPNDQSLFQAAGRLEERVGNYTGARDLYTVALSVEPSAHTLVAFAMLELRHPIEKPANITRVKRLFEEALVLDPRHGPVYNAYGNMEFNRGNVNRARQIYECGIKAQCTDTASVYHGLGKLELSLGNVDVARNILNKGLVEIKKREARSMDSVQYERGKFLTHTLGMLELNSNRASEALKIFESGIERHNENSSSQLLLGAALCQVKLGNEKAARSLFERAVKVDKRHPQAWQAWGVMEMKAGNFFMAQKLFDLGIRNIPEHGALWNAYATMEGRMGNIEIARSLFAAGVKKCQHHVQLYQGWAALEMRTGNYVKAKELIGEALTRNKKLGSGWLVSAEIEEQLGNDDLAGLILQRGIECCPNDAELYCALGNKLANKGKINNAREMFEKGLDMNPLHAPLYHSYAELEARIGNIAGLAELNTRAAEIFKKNALDTSSQSSSIAWGKKIRKSRRQHANDSSKNEKVGGDSWSAADHSSTTITESMMEDEVVKGMFRADDAIGFPDHATNKTTGSQK